MSNETKIDGLAILRKPFPANQISKLPKPTKQQTEEVRNDFKKGARCEICGAWHHPKVVHLDYVGHAALTDRLLDADPTWSWEPLSFDANGQPLFDKLGGLWVRLTVCGVTRLGYGHAGDKSGGDAIKEIIGDALRNAAMRFGAALDLWHKGDLHADEPEPKSNGPGWAGLPPSDAESEAAKPTQAKKVLAPEMKVAWANALAAYKRDKNLVEVLKRYDVSQVHQTQLIEEGME